MSRLRERYQNEVAPALKKEFGYGNVMAIPRIRKVVINMGLGEATSNAKLADVGAELHVARVDRLHHRVGLVARLHTGARVLVQHADDADLVERPAHVIERLDDAGLVTGEVIVPPLDVIRTDDGDRATALLD